jgi:nitrogen fixation protein NifU and related proteins
LWGHDEVLPEEVDQGRIADAKYQVLGCPGAVSAAMALVDLVKGKTLDEALQVKDRDVLRRLVQIPDQKQHCIRLAVKTLKKGDQFDLLHRGELWVSFGRYPIPIKKIP